MVAKTREVFEQRRVSKTLLRTLYGEYNPSVDGQAFIKEAEEMFPKLNCGLASVYLRHILGGEIIQGKYEDNRHTFLLLGENVIDITADQYGGPKVYVGALQYPWSRQ